MHTLALPQVDAAVWRGMPLFLFNFQTRVSPTSTHFCQM